ncbi:hypothetical protein EP1X_06305 [Thermococcus sp. EP1]|nr:hypothetical protein EP1X_06305 [Thermococcus sp. EP1]
MTFILNLTPIFVAILSVLFLKETPSVIQIVGITLVILGVKIFFTESVLVFNERIGILITLVSGIGWAVYMILMRHYLRENHESVISLTAISMGVGALMLLGVTASSGYITMPSLKTWGIILILSIVNTAFAFVLWNHALKYLKAYEQSILQNTMLIQITLLAYAFLGETLTIHKVIGMIIVFCGVLLVQLSPIVCKNRKFKVW